MISQGPKTHKYDALKKADVSLVFAIVSDEDVLENEEEIPLRLTPLKGTMKLHQVFTKTEGQIQYRDVSCFCSTPNDCECFHPQTMCHKTPVDSNITSEVTLTASDVPDTPNLVPFGITNIEIDESLKGLYCVVSYDGKPYPGIIQDVDQQEVEVNVMNSVGDNRFFWPMMQDVLWYSIENFVTLISPPEKTGSRHYQIETGTWENIKRVLNL